MKKLILLLFLSVVTHNAISSEYLKSVHIIGTTHTPANLTFEDSQRLASSSRFKELVNCIITKSKPRNISKIEITCLHILNDASLEINTTDRKRNTTSVKHVTRKQWYEGYHTKSPNSVFGHLPLNRQNYSSDSNITLHDIHDIIQSIHQNPTLLPQEKHHIGNICLGDLPGKITLTQSNKLIITTFS